MTDYRAEIALIKQACSPIKGAYIAGGAITSVFTGKQVNDADIYFKTEAAFQEAVANAYDNSWWCVATSGRSVTFSDNGRIIQFMHFGFYPVASDIFAAFDFTVCMAALDFDSGDLVFHPDFLKHNSQRFLRFNPGTKYPLASATRVLKYQQRGYTIGKGDILKIALACRTVRIDSWEDLKDQIGGAYGDKVVLAGDGQEFSLAAAIDALTVDAEGQDTWMVHANDNNEPGNAEALLMKIADMKGVPYVAPTLDWWADEFGVAA